MAPGPDRPRARRPETLYATAFEIDATWLIQAAARRQKWIDQAQSLNLYIAKAERTKARCALQGSLARGLKTTYYLRSRSATHVEKSTLQTNRRQINAVSIMPAVQAAETIVLPSATACLLEDPTCEDCQ